MVEEKNNGKLSLKEETFFTVSGDKKKRKWRVRNKEAKTRSNLSPLTKKKEKRKERKERQPAKSKKKEENKSKSKRELFVRLSRPENPPK